MVWKYSRSSAATLTFLKGGIHPDDHKGQTRDLPIETLPTPPEVCLPLSQHSGDPAEPLVKRGDVVRRGQLIAAAQGTGVPVHASITGKVARVTNAPHPIWVNAPAITIEAQSSESPLPPLEFPQDPRWTQLTPADMLTRIREAGLVGLGGAAFPTYRKLSLPPNARVDTLIINGAECEPYLTSDHRLMLEETEKIILGAWLMAKIIGVSQCIFGIEDNKWDAAQHLKDTLSHLQPDKFSTPVSMRVALTRTRYPQGSEKQLIQALIRRQVPQGKLPLHVGVIVQNVATAAACLGAIRFRRPLLDRVITVSGQGIRTPKNLRVPLGTSIATIAEFCGGLDPNVVKIISGGPMMGRPIASLDVPIIKGTSGLLFLTQSETHLGSYGPCIQCGACLEACPLGLEPNRIALWVEAGQPLQTKKYGTLECFECGCCAYACPSRRPLVQFIQISKAAYQREQETQTQLTGTGVTHG